MRLINEYIDESLTKVQRQIVGKYIIGIFSKSKLQKDKIKEMLKGISNENDMTALKEINTYIENIDKENSLPYTSVSDDFLKKDNFEKILDRLAQYIEKYVANI